MPKIQIEINNCRDCIFCIKNAVDTTKANYACRKSRNRALNLFVKDYEELNVPSWCPILVKE